MEGSEVNIQGQPGALVCLIVLPFIVPLSPSSAFETLRRTLFTQAGRGDQCGWPSTPKLLRLLDVTATNCRKGPPRLTLGLQRLHWNVYVGRPRLSDSSDGLSLQTEGDKLPYSAFWAAGFLWTYDLVFLFSVPRTPGRGGTSNFHQNKKTGHFLTLFSHEKSNQETVAWLFAKPHLSCKTPLHAIDRSRHPLGRQTCPVSYCFIASLTCRKARQEA